MTTPFAAFAPAVVVPTPLRLAITAAYRRPEPECVASLLDEATLDEPTQIAVRDTARRLIAALRATPKTGGVEGLVKEYSLSSQEGVALMCLAEALLRIPDAATRDALIRDKIAKRDWRSHIGGRRSLFVNAATWGLVVTGKLLNGADEPGLSAALTRLVVRAGEPVIRRAVDLAMRMMGEQFVTGETINEALTRSRAREAEGFAYSYDMLGEAATTAEDADRYYRDYEAAIHAIGRAAAGRGVHEGAGISIKLSALHPRYVRAQVDRVMGELLAVVKTLATLAKGYDIGFNIDAEEADRLELSLDLLERLALDPDLAGWNGLGFVVQSYGKRCPFVIDWIVDLARRANRRIMVRLVKGAYWDAEIKRAQVDGLDFPVYTRKVHTDVAYIACARRLLAAPEAVFPQFATHNARTLATIYHLAGPAFRVGDYEFQCLHGMGEPLYEQVVGRGKLDRPCRIYAPVGTHETLLAYLVRRLLENGANSSFVNRIGDAAIQVDELIVDPVEEARAAVELGAPHPEIALSSALYPDRRNSAGIDLSDENALAALAEALRESASVDWIAGDAGDARPVLNPADHGDVVGYVHEVSADEARAAVTRAAACTWASTPIADRAAALDRAADAMQARMSVLLGLIMREAGKSAPNAIAEVREAIDFLRYYAARARRTFGVAQVPLGPIVCISPWNFPLAIFTGQVAAALVAGNPVLAKPAEETPLIAAESVRLLHQVGVPNDALQLVCGAGDVGAALVGAEATMGVMFTGSTDVARLIQKQLASRVSSAGQPIPLVAETGGQNAMIVDSSALAEQVVADVIASAFDSAGQRCSALRILCLQEEVADRTLAMLKGALKELRMGRTDRLAVDIGPVITAEAKVGIETHVARMRDLGCRVEQQDIPDECARGTFVPPTIIELDSIADLSDEVFGPVLHVVRYRRESLDELIDSINATGYGLTFGAHTRLDETIAHVTGRVKAGNLYINRNVIGAVVGVQPFGGRGLSGTGPKAGGPLYLGRLVQEPPRALSVAPPQPNEALDAFAAWLVARGEEAAAAQARAYSAASMLGGSTDLPGPVGERNTYALHARGRILLYSRTELGLYDQIAAVLATGCDGVIAAMPIPPNLPPIVLRRLTTDTDGPLAGVLVEGDGDAVRKVARTIADLPGAILPIHAASSAPGRGGAYHLDRLVDEVSISINTTAAGGNASLMTIGL